MTPEQMIDDIELHGSNVSDWEMNFIIDISNKLEMGYTLSEKQINKLKAIHEDRV